MVRRLRAAVGDDATIMFDCFMGWDLEHARRMFPVLMEANPKWIEEPFPPRFLDDFRAIHREFPNAPLATGEHLYTRWEVKPFLDEGLLTVVQSDPDWCGGITELVRICEMAASYGVKVVPHGHTIAAAIQVIAAQPETICPLVEVLPRHHRRMHWFHRDRIEPVRGMVAVPQAPGLSIEWDESSVRERREVFA
jgi:L-alanine-DL-glutamate epimerase-like enolase superfamily enzyme